MEEGGSERREIKVKRRVHLLSDCSEIIKGSNVRAPSTFLLTAACLHFGTLWHEQKNSQYINMFCITVTGLLARIVFLPVKQLNS